VITGISEGIQYNLLKIKETDLVDGTITTVSEVMNSDITTLHANAVHGARSGISEGIQIDLLDVALFVEVEETDLVD